MQQFVFLKKSPFEVRIRILQTNVETTENHMDKLDKKTNFLYKAEVLDKDNLKWNPRSIVEYRYKYSKGKMKQVQ